MNLPDLSRVDPRRGLGPHDLVVDERVEYVMAGRGSVFGAFKGYGDGGDSAYVHVDGMERWVIVLRTSIRRISEDPS